MDNAIVLDDYRILFFDAGRLQQEYERARAAVHDRNFRGGQVDIDIIDAETRHGRQQVLNGCDFDAVFYQRCAQHGLTDKHRVCGNIHRLIEVDAAKRYAGIFRSRAQCHIDFFARVQADAGGTYGGFEGSLSQHCHSRRKTSSELKTLQGFQCVRGRPGIAGPALRRHATQASE